MRPIDFGRYLMAPAIVAASMAIAPVAHACLTDLGCAATPTTPLCDLLTGTCVQCTALATQACTASGAGTACLADGLCGCQVDSDCGGSSSGRVCDTVGSQMCVVGCRGTGGNGCPTGEVCTSAGQTIGTCTPGVTDGGASGGDAGSSTGDGGSAKGDGGASGGGDGSVSPTDGAASGDGGHADSGGSHADGGHSGDAAGTEGDGGSHGHADSGAADGGAGSGNDSGASSRADGGSGSAGQGADAGASGGYGLGGGGCSTSGGGAAAGSYGLLLGVAAWFSRRRVRGANR